MLGAAWLDVCDFFSYFSSYCFILSWMHLSTSLKSLILPSFWIKIYRITHTALADAKHRAFGTVNV